MNFNYDNTVSAGDNLKNYWQFFSKKFYSSNIELKISTTANSFSPVKIDFYGYLIDYITDLMYDPALTKERVLDIIYDLKKVIKRGNYIKCIGFLSQKRYFCTKL